MEICISAIRIYPATQRCQIAQWSNNQRSEVASHQRHYNVVTKQKNTTITIPSKGHNTTEEGGVSGKAASVLKFRLMRLTVTLSWCNIHIEPITVTILLLSQHVLRHKPSPRMIRIVANKGRQASTYGLLARWPLATQQPITSLPVDLYGTATLVRHVGLEFFP